MIDVLDDIYYYIGAVYALGEIGDERAVKPLIRLYKDKVEPYNSYIVAYSDASDLSEASERVQEYIAPLISALKKLEHLKL